MFGMLSSWLAIKNRQDRRFSRKNRRKADLVVEALENRSVMSPVTLTMTRFEQIGNPDSGDATEGDYYARIRIAGNEFQWNLGSIDPAVGADPHVIETSQTFTQDVDPRLGDVIVEINFFDKDKFIFDELSPDDHVDVSPIPGDKTLTLSVDPITGTWSGDVPLNTSFARGNGEGDGEGSLLISFAISVLSTNGDADGDGLLDSWEKFGVDYNGDGLKLDLPRFGADPLHKDLFVELDWMPGQAMSREEIRAVTAAFSVAPIWAGTNASALPGGNDAQLNPDGKPGINLWIDSLNGDGFGSGNNGNEVPTANVPSLTSSFYAIKRDNFSDPDRWPVFRYGLSAQSPTNGSGTSTGRNGARTLFDTGKNWNRDEWSGYQVTVTDASGMRSETRAIVGNTANALTVDKNWTNIPDNTWTYAIQLAGGWGEIGGNDFIVYGGVNPVDGSVIPVDGGTFMHELGHTLNLGHGGADGVNFKPNYVSVMNYDHQFGLVQGTIDSSMPSILDFSGPRITVPGVATGGDSETLNDFTANWTVDQWAGSFVEVVDIDGLNRQVRAVVSNTPTQLVLANPWTSTPTSTSRYALYSANPARGSAPLANLTENNLRETLVFDGADSSTVIAFRDASGNRQLWPASGADRNGDLLPDGPDYNADGLVNFGALVFDVNADTPAGATSPTLSTLIGHDDWRRISLPFRQFGDSADAGRNVSEETPMNHDHDHDHDRRVLTVTTSADGGIGSLRQAILDANAIVGPNTIVFAIAATDPNCRDLDGHLAGGDAANDVVIISPRSPLPALADPTGATVIDGHSQASFAGDTNRFGPEVVLRGTDAGNADGLRLESNDNQVYGLSIVGFRGNGMVIEGSRNTVTGNYVGVDPLGRAHGNGGHGILIQGNDGQKIVHGNRIGLPTQASPPAPPNDANLFAPPPTPSPFPGTVDGGSDFIVIPPGEQPTPPPATAGWSGNVISANRGDGVMIGPNTRGNFVEANIIGADPSKTKPLGNRHGVVIDNSAGNVVGRVDPAAANVIAYNGTGVGIVGTREGNAVRGNSIHDNKELGIDLGMNGATANDIRDRDRGPNGLQNYPLLQTVTNQRSGKRVTGMLRSLPRTRFTLDFYANAAADPSGLAEGQRFLRSINVRTDATGMARFSVLLNARANEVISATATDVVRGNTSEFSRKVVDWDKALRAHQVDWSSASLVSKSISDLWLRPLPPVTDVISLIDVDIISPIDRGMAQTFRPTESIRLDLATRVFSDQAAAPDAMNLGSLSAINQDELAALAVLKSEAT